MLSSNRPAESRRSTAAQFFMDEEDGATKEDKRSIQEKVVDLINQASLMHKESARKIQNLRQVQEFIIHQDRTLLDNFLDEVLAFQHDTVVDVRKFVVGFIEEACKIEPDILPKVVANLNMMLVDEAPAVQKKVIQTATHLYKVALKWLCDARVVDDIMESTWTYMTQLKASILALLDCDNDGVRTHSIKFMEMLVILQTYPDTESPDKLLNEIALDDVPVSLKIARPRKLEEEAKQIFDALIAFHGTPHISSVNLMGCMQTLTSIAKHRCEFMSKVIQALESLHANLPPTLAKSQVSSVRKHLKLQLLTLLKHPAAVDFHVQITVLLNDLGATQSEISKCLPKVEDMRKRAKLMEDERQQNAKRMKLDPEPEMEDEEDEEEEEEVILEAEIIKSMPSVMSTNTAIDITADDIMQKLTPVNVTDLVLVSMLSLPDQMPAQFQASYTPIAVAGTDMQVKHLARLIATQVTAAGIGKGIQELVKSRVQPSQSQENEDQESNELIRTVVGGRTRGYQETKKKEKVQVVLLPTGLQSKPSRRVKAINLSENIRPLSDDQADRLCEITMRRIMDAERTAAQGGISQTRVKILSCLASQFKGHISEMLKSFIFEDLRNRADLALSWLYEEYATYQCFNQMSRITGKPTPDHYDKCLFNLLHRLLELRDHKDKDMLFSRFFLDVPSIPENCIEVLSNYCQDEATVQQGLQTVRLLIEKRPPKQLLFLCVLLDLSLSEKPEIRNHSVRVAKQLHERGDLRPLIETFALKNLKYLLNPLPPDDMVPNKTRPPPPNWSEESAKICLHLYLALLPINHKLIHDLANVYVGTIADVKRTILRVLESPVKGMGMSSPELLLLVENCPKGAETLVTRIIHILTDKAPPSAELVSRVRDLYHKRVPDVRFLIPVLNGLTKKEVVAALPKLIKLNPIVVKEVFNRLLGSHAESSSSVTSPLTPAELLVSLHNIDPSKCDMKTIIKATSLCFAEKHIYTQEVLAVVMQQLMEQSPLPTLLMRTVIQSLSLYPRLIGFVMNILQRLIIKQVWKQKKVWEGFIKCCQRTKPQSFQVLLQLPPPQLANAFQMSPELREPLLQHVHNFTEHQRAHIPQAIMDLLQGPPEEEEELPEIIAIEPVPVLTSASVPFIKEERPSSLLEDVSNDSEPAFDSVLPEPTKIKEELMEEVPPQATTSPLTEATDGTEAMETDRAPSETLPQDSINPETE